MKIQSNTNRFQNIISVVLLIVLAVSIFIDIFIYIQPMKKVSEIDLRLLGLEKLIYNVDEEE
jgi:hypothetical protein